MNKRTLRILGIIQIFVAIGALPAGYSMIVVPNGSGLGMSVDILKSSLFNDFFIPGLFLFMVNGILNLVGAFLCFFKSKYAPIAGIVLGYFLILWIAVQVYSIGLNHILQPTYFIIGIAEIILGFVLRKRIKSYSYKQSFQLLIFILIFL